MSLKSMVQEMVGADEELKPEEVISIC
jgi:hypothetical protein